MSDNILRLPANDEIIVGEEDPVTIADRRPVPCHHGQVVVHEEQRELRCRDCGALVDPMDYLAAWAKRAESRRREHRRLDEQEAPYRTHALGANTLTLCGLGPATRGMSGRPWTLRLTNEPKRVNCHNCRDRMAKGPQEAQP